MRYFKFPIFLLAVACFYSCTDKNEPDVAIADPIDLRQSWQPSSSAQENIDDLSVIVTNANQLKRLTSILVFRNGKLVTENYFKGFKKDSLHDVRSVTKSVMALLVGIALENGFLTSVNDPIKNYLSSNEFALTEPQKEITINHLLTMSGGFQWNETNGNSYNEWILSGKPVDFLLEKPLTDSPGSVFNYNSAAVHLLGIVLNKATKMTVPAFADQYLFKKIGIEKVQWEQFEESYINGGSGIQLKPEDMGRIGQLMLQKGKSGTEIIVSENWIKSMTDPYYTWRNNYGALRNYTYGKLWWVHDAALSKAYFAWGFGGQIIYVVPEKNLVIITTTNWIKSSEAGGVEIIEQEAFDLILNKLLPKVR